MSAVFSAIGEHLLAAAEGGASLTQGRQAGCREGRQAGRSVVVCNRAVYVCLFASATRCKHLVVDVVAATVHAIKETKESTPTSSDDRARQRGPGLRSLRDLGLMAWLGPRGSVLRCQIGAKKVPGFP